MAEREIVDGLLRMQQSLHDRPFALPYADGLAVASASQWLNNFAVSRATPVMVLKLSNGKVFFFFGAMNMLSLLFALWMPETSKHSLEAMGEFFFFFSFAVGRCFPPS